MATFHHEFNLQEYAVLIHLTNQLFDDQEGNKSGPLRAELDGNQEGILHDIFLKHFGKPVEIDVVSIPVPKPIRQLFIEKDSVMSKLRLIYFWAVGDAADDMRQFGCVDVWDQPNHYRLAVSGLYDFNQVLEYMRNYDKQDD